MPSLTLTEGDLASLAAALAPLLVPYVRKALIDDATNAVATFDIDDVDDMGSLGTVIGSALKDIIGESDEKRFANLQPITIGRIS